MKKLPKLISLIPTLEEAPWGKKIPAFAEFRFVVRYPHEGRSSQVAFVYGKNKKEDMIYVSRYARGKDNFAPNVADIGLSIDRILAIEVRRFYR